MIEFENVSVVLGKSEILKNINCKIGDKCLLLGPNGSGKTTLIRTAVGLVKPTRGRVLIDGKEVERVVGGVGLVTSNIEELFHILRISTYDCIRLFCDLLSADADLVFEKLADFGIDTKLLKKRKIWELSSGQRKIVTSVVALLSGCRHVLLDEPFEQLDPARKLKILGLIQEFNANILVSTHETWLIDQLKGWNVYFMFEGKLYGPVSVDIMKNAKIVVGRSDKSVLTFEISGRPVSLVLHEEGISISQIMTLDKVYEIALVAR